MTINILTIECEGVAGISARNDAAGQAFTKVTLENVPRFELMAAIQAVSTIEEILTHITAHDIALYMKQGNKNLDGVTVTVKGVDNVFKGDELTSPLHQAEAFIGQLAKAEELF